MKILVAADGSPFTKRMLAYIAAHDELFGTAHEYTAITVVPPIPPHATGFLSRDVIDAYYQEQAEAVLEPVRAFAKQAGWTLLTRHAVGSAGDAVAELANTGKFDLVVMGTHGHSSLVGVVLGSVTTRTIAQCQQPVLLVR